MRTVASTAFGGLAVATARAARSGYKLANINTQRFDPLREASQEPAQAGTPSYATALAESSRVHNFQGRAAGTDTDIAFEAIEQISAVHAFRASVAMLQADDERYGSLLDIKV